MPVCKVTRWSNRRREAHAGVWYENLRERDHLEDLGEDAGIIQKWVLNMISGAWSVLVFRRICGLLLWAPKVTVGFHEMKWVSSPFDAVLASLQGFYPMEFIYKACKIPGRFVFFTPSPSPAWMISCSGCDKFCHKPPALQFYLSWFIERCWQGLEW
jgi:hypothetical protein